MGHVDAELMAPRMEDLQRYANTVNNTTIILIVGIVASTKMFTCQSLASVSHMTTFQNQRPIHRLHHRSSQEVRHRSQHLYLLLDQQPEDIKVNLDFD